MRLSPAIALLLLACGAIERSRSGEKLVVGVGEDQFPLALNRERLARYPLNAEVCETLVELRPDFSLAPGLASRWEQLEPDGVRFYLQRNVTFSDGSPLTADDVVHTIRHNASLRMGYSFLTDSSAKAINDSVVEIRSSSMNRRLLEQMVHATYGIVSSRGDPATAPLCTGPYRVASYKPHEQLTVVRNERYRGPPPRTDTVTFRFLPDESTRVLALKAGDVDMISDYGSRGGGASPAGFELIAAPPGAVLMIYINRNGSAPYNQMADQKLRRAVAHSLDRSALVTRIMPPGDVPATTVGPSSVLGQWAGLVKGVPYDTVEARRLAGTRVRPLTLIYNVNVVDKAVAEFVQASLRTVGIPLRVEGLDAASFDSRINAGTFDIDLEIPNQNDANPAFLLALRWYSKSGVPSAKFTHASPAYDGIIEEALLAADLESVRHAAARAAHQLVDVEAGAIPLAGISRRWLLSPYVSGFEPHPARLYQRWSTISVQK